jgi:hypothetical protein
MLPLSQHPSPTSEADPPLTASTAHIWLAYAHCAINTACHGYSTVKATLRRKHGRGLSFHHYCAALLDSLAASRPASCQFQAHLATTPLAFNHSK